MSKRWMIYGANGYTGRLVAQLAAGRGLQPILAGRNAGRIETIAGELGLPHRVFDLADPKAVREGLEGVDAVLHTAGPFSATSRQMVQGCIEKRTHYLDVTGEIAVFEQVFGCDEDARRAGISLVPGVGFDVVPTDCLAAMAARELPNTMRLELAIAGLDTMSQGTWKSTIEGLGRGGFARLDGRIVPVPVGWKRREIPFPHRTLRAVTIPWGDLSTAYRTTGAPDIWVYAALAPSMQRALPLIDRLRPVLRRASVQRALKRAVERAVRGPDDTTRQHGYTDVWVEATDAQGTRVTGTLTGPDGYTLTADASVRAVLEVLDGKVRPGAWTPSLAFGPDFVRGLDGVVVHALQRDAGA